jgi:hypothetical protein
MRNLIYKLFVFFGLVASLLAYNFTKGAATQLLLTNDNNNSSEKVYFLDIISSFADDTDLSVGHYSHRSHSSHYSHESHHSHYSHYSSW